MSTAPTAPSLIEANAGPLAQRALAAVDHICMVLGYEWAGPRHVADQRRELEQAIAELQAAQAELDPPVAATD